MRSRPGLLVAVVALAGCGGSWHNDPVARHAEPQLAEHQLLGIAEAAAVRAGDPKPTLIQHSEGTRQSANLVDSGEGVNGRQWSYLIAERGHFAYTDVNLGSGPEPRGTVLTVIVNASTGHVTDDGLSNRYPNLDRLGPVHTDLRR